MTATSQSNGQAILAILESDLLTAEGSPLIALLTAQTAAAGDPFKEIAALSAFRGAVIGSLPGLESGVIAQIDNAIIVKVQAAIAKAQAGAAGNTTAPAAASAHSLA
jgi:hypothetical protein